MFSEAFLSENIDNALEAALDAPIGVVSRSIYENASRVDAKYCNAFLTLWYDSLPSSGERFSMAISTFDLYVLDLVHLQGAEDIAIGRVLQAATDVSGSIRDALTALPAVAQSPESRVSDVVAQEIEDLATEQVAVVLSSLEKVRAKIPQP